ncbi:uncharacterized protein EKO05_0007706 [Ascochyta rabiei]|uniref:Uncharacterized protein n=1 Tax=Didymella rabiei TaxID=5454 RepID=A0A162VEQ4_DIDRA|nr:uncharacterized protein EKO05_0007706 [Ascochyta rabiei]KZM18409.1 hypothetical protein ST47_g10439 [Ascochyta rabiei]UPX17344.1 hypothetical protein EKO05_0007706 [Ascochyta rabiei]
MRSTIPITTLALFMSTFSSAAPTEAKLEPVHFPRSNLTTKVLSADTMTCPNSGSSCGVVTFASGLYVSFGPGVCMQLGKNIESIYVAHCYCSLWSSCTGNSKKDVYVGGMMMCEKPKTLDEFGQEVRFISCGGLY